MVGVYQDLALIVEDDQLLSRVLVTVAETAGWRVSAVDSVAAGDQVLSQTTPQLVLADWQVRDGVAGPMLSQVLKDSPSTRVVVLSGQLTRAEKYRLYQQGVTEVLTKPSDTQELEWKFRRWAEWSRKLSHQSLSKAVGQFRVDAELGGVWYQQQFCELRPVEFRIMECFCTHINQVLSKTQIAEYVWGVRTAPHPTTIEVYVMRLRRALPRPEFLQTRRGFGYVLREREY